MSSKGAEIDSFVFRVVFTGVIVVTWAMVLTSVGLGIFSSGTALSLEGDAREITGLRRASELLASDLRDAERTSLVDEAGWETSVTLSWTDRGLSLPRIVQYALQDDTLMRVEDGIAKAVAQDILSTHYSLAGSEFRALFGVRTEPGVTETVSLRIDMP